MSEMKPCPFCGGDALECKNSQGREMYWVLCRSCHCGPYERRTPEAAITAWNTRPTEDRLVGALEEAEMALEALISTFTPQTPLEDPVHGEEVATLGRRIGFGALMVSAAATWRDQSCVAGGEFVVGPCALTADVELAKARAALTRIRAAKGGE